MLLTGKILSARLIQAYISSMRRVMGNGGSSAVLTILPDMLSEDLKTSKKPFWDFYLLDGANWVDKEYFDNSAYLQDTDQVYAKQLTPALAGMYGEKGGIGLSQAIGKWIWQGFIRNAVHERIMLDWKRTEFILNPAYNGEQKEYSLLFFAREPILNALKAHFNLSQVDTLQSLPSEKYLIAAKTLAQVLNENLQIACDVEEQSDGIFLSFPDCPFCASQECKTWWGIIEGMYLWLDDQEPFIIGQASPINEERSTTHRIFIAKSST